MNTPKNLTRYRFTPRPERMDSLTTNELKHLQRQWEYEAGVYYDDGTPSVMARIAAVAREHGQDPVSIRDPGYRSTYGPKFTWNHEMEDGTPINVFVDDYGGYITVIVGGKSVASTHSTNRFFVPGKWVDAVLSLYPPIYAKKQQEEVAKVDAERDELVSLLSATS